jgi:hypothetical protein
VCSVYLPARAAIIHTHPPLFRYPYTVHYTYSIVRCYGVSNEVRHGGIVKQSVVRCVTVFACFTYLLTVTEYRLFQVV